MDTAVQVALTGAVAGVVAALVNGVVAPRINWGIERKRINSQYRKDHLHAWRKLIFDMTERYKPDSVPQAKEAPLEFLNGSTAFYSLRPMLTSPSLNALNTTSYEQIRSVLINEIARIEKEWGLF